MYGYSVSDSEYKNLDNAIKNVMRKSASDAVLLGHLLRRMMDEKLWMRQYSSLDDYLKEDSKVQTFLHDMEFAPDGKERNKIDTRLQQSRRERRRKKDIVQLYANVHSFYTEKQNQGLLKALRRLQNEQVTAEKYLFGNREFKNRVE